MALPISGKTYRFKCAGATTRYLNLYSSGTASDGMNVVLYTGDSSNEQKWRYDGSKLRPLTNTAFALDKYTVSGNANNNNADIWTANDPTNQNITFSAVSGNTVKIKLAGAALYLTAYSNANGTGTGKTPTSAGNVYWASSSSSAMQQWTFEEVGGGATNPYAALNWSYVFSDSNNASGYWGYSPTGASNSNNGSPHVHWGIDVICNTGIALRAPAAAAVFETGSGDDRGNYIVLKMNQTDPVSGRSMYVRFLHMRDPALITTGSVAKNKTLGYVGNSGTVTPHLHLDINTKTSSQASGSSFSSANTINPVKLFPNISFPSNYYRE